MLDGEDAALARGEHGGAEVEQAEPMPEPPVTEEKPKRRKGKKLAAVSASDEAAR